MGPDQTARSIRAHRRVRSLVPIVAVALLGGSTFAGCSGDHGAGATAATWTFAPDATTAGTAATPAAAESAWAHRPDFTHASAATEAAYAYALNTPRVIEWFPCYCGCGTMGHRSNLDCYFKPTADGTITFEEHASFCDICVQITLKAKELIAQGMSLRDARAAIDEAFAGGVPGTPTEVPPL